MVHEAYLRLVDVEKAQRWDSRGHFFAAAAEAMRRILVENTRRKRGLKHGGGFARAEVEIADLPTQIDADELIDLDEALNELGRRDAIKAKLVTLRYFGGLTIEQAAQTLSISRVTAHRYWRFSRAWLHRRLKTGDTTDARGRE